MTAYRDRRLAGEHDAPKQTQPVEAKAKPKRTPQKPKPRRK